MPLTRYAEVFPIYARAAITQASGTNPVQSTPECDYPHRFDLVLAHSSAAADRDVRLSAYVAAVDYYLGTVTVPAGSGFTTVPAVDLVAALIEPPNDGIVLPGGAVLRASLSSALGAGETLTLICAGGTV
jgi:hypothetical protein